MIIDTINHISVKIYRATNQKGSNKMNNFFKKATTVTMATLLLVVPVTSAYAHGFIVNDRAHLGSNRGGNININMGGIRYEPQSAGEVTRRYAVENGFMSLNDAVSVNAGAVGGFPRMSDFGEGRFARVQMATGVNEIQWIFTAPHRTSTIVYYISRPGFDVNAPLNFADFEYMASFNYNGLSPARAETLHTHLVHIPTDRSGAHAILAAWHVSDNDVSWYRIKDIYVAGEGDEVTQPGVVIPPSGPGTPDRPGHHDPRAWRPGFVFTEGDIVIHAGNEWRAMWWTQGDEPGTTGEWGVWRLIGPVAPPTHPDVNEPDEEKDNNDSNNEDNNNEVEKDNEEKGNDDTPKVNAPDVDLPMSFDRVFSNVAGTVYNAGEVVLHNGNLYRVVNTFTFNGDSSWAPSGGVLSLWQAL